MIPNYLKLPFVHDHVGGGAKFEQLALYGDKIVDMHLYKYLISKSWELKGDITSCRTTIHKEPVIKAFADSLGIPDILTPLDSTYHPNDNDLAETVEALIGAAFEVNGLERCFPIVSSFVIFSIKEQKKSRKLAEFDKSQNYKGKLLELYQKLNSNTPGSQLNVYDPNVHRIGGTDDSPIFQFEGDITYDGEKYYISTDKWPNKKLAEQEAAYRALCAINGNNPEYTKFNLTRDNMQASQEKTVHPTTSIDNKELIFRKPAPDYDSIEVNQNTGELFVDWVNRKGKKNVFGMLKLLSARLDTVSAAS